MEVLKSNKNAKKLSLDGYMYIVKIRLPAKIRWECWRRRNEGCQGSLITDINDENPIVKNLQNPQL